ncbi:chromosome segregation protein ParM [Embleya sp. NPDC020630]|uniref:chromosome segregation protein ParM n=1 Tax=Embleya sp. NPDC020630 TaxID=3363979 RepID=UPI0037B218E5
MSRSVAVERLTYALAAPTLAAAPNIAPDGVPNSVLILAGATGTLATLRATTGHEGVGRKMVRWSPLVTGLAVDLTAIVTPGWGWDALLAAAWAVTGCAILPLSRTTRRRHRPALDHTPGPRPRPAPSPAAHAGGGKDPLTRGAAAMWERAGSPGRCHVVRAVPHDGMPHDMTVLLRADELGRPIRGVSEADAAAAFGVDESDVRLNTVPRQEGRQGGPGWLEVHVIPDAGTRRRSEPTDEEKWIDRIARPGGGAPGSRLVDITRDRRRRVTFYRAEMEDAADDPRVDPDKVCRGLGVPYDDARVFLLVEGHRFLLSVFDEPPLSRTFRATRELLTPDAKGMFVCGYTITGQPVRSMVWQADKDAACHALVLGVSRSGKTQYFALTAAAQSLAGGVVWLSTVRPDGKIGVLGRHVDRQGANPLWMVRSLRAAKALCEIRAEMPWAHDGRPHDFKPGDPRCPYPMLNVYCDEYMTATKDPLYGAEIQTLGDDLTVTGLKYGIGLCVAGQSPFVDDGFSTAMKDNLRQNSRPIVFNCGSPGATRKAVEGTMTDAHDVPLIPARYAASEGSAIDRAISGEADPENGVGTGGVAVIVLDNGRPVLVKTLLADFETDLADLFPDTINRLTAHEITGLDERGLWGDWNAPDEDLEDDDPGDDEGRDDHRPRRKTKNGQSRGGRDNASPRGPGGGGGSRPPRKPITSAREALAAIASLDD